MSLDWTLRIGDALQIVLVVFGAVAFFLRVEGANKVLEANIKTLSESLVRVEGQMGVVAETMVKLAVQDERLNNHADRLSLLEKDLRYMRDTRRE